MNKLWYAFIAIVVVVGGVLLLTDGGVPTGEVVLEMPVPETAGILETIVTPEGSGITVEFTSGHAVRVTANGFEPASLTVKKGDRVTWMNEAGREVWPASAVHPTHTAYPGSDIAKCGTAEAATIFDACGGITNGSAWSFVFNEAGTWRYHDHLRASVTGSVVVE